MHREDQLGVVHKASRAAHRSPHIALMIKSIDGAILVSCFSHDISVLKHAFVAFYSATWLYT